LPVGVPTAQSGCDRETTIVLGRSRLRLVAGIKCPSACHTSGPKCVIQFRAGQRTVTALASRRPTSHPGLCHGPVRFTIGRNVCGTPPAAPDRHARVSPMPRPRSGSVDGALHIPGMTDVVFPEISYITAEALVDAALSGLDRNKLVTVPTCKKAPHRTKWRCSKSSSSGSVISGKIADRYLSDG